MKKIALSAIAALVLSVGVFQVALAMGGDVQAAAVAAFAAAVAAAVVATVFIAFAAAALATAAAVVAAAVTAFIVAAAVVAAAVTAFAAAAAFAVFAFAAFAAFAIAAAAKKEGIPFKWAMAVYGILGIGVFSALLLPTAFPWAIVGVGAIAILGVWWLYAMRQSQALAA